ncbi:ATP-binding protein [Nodosilinea sp. P-1105]|uniref:ATP-binding protein n=1 Tax=Nodosilinea sp. P-1105 TaxID=2546229 RepID=UPI00146E9D7F|nr:ATP-binding protein [Nodosilinea sp. P-1105]NMF83088.1 ATP-binding protein [Nodosilinea sp. P-1105]
MSPPGPPYSNEAILAHNQAALTELERAITLRPDRFSLVLTHCNYHRLRTLVVQQLKATCPIMELPLPPHTPTLSHALAQAMPLPAKTALMVTGLDAVAQLPTMLRAANLGRDELPKGVSVPVVLWVSDRSLQHISRHAPDLASFANAPIRFTYPPGELLYSLHQHAHVLFATMLSLGDDSPYAASAYQPGSALRTELEFALADIANQHDALDAELEASLNFLKGRDALRRGDLEVARFQFETSLGYWQGGGSGGGGEMLALSGVEGGRWGDGEGGGDGDEISSVNSPTPSLLQVPAPTPREKQAILLFYLGTTWRSLGALHRAFYQDYLEQARSYFEACLAIFRQGKQLDLVAKFIHALGEVQQKLADWAALEHTARQGLTLHRSDPVRLARDHGYLAEVALAKGDPLGAKAEAERALEILTIAQVVATSGGDGEGLGVANQFQRGWYLFLLAQVQQALGQPSIPLLQAALTHTRPNTDLLLYRRILETLRQQYFQQKDYRAAFQTKLEQRQVETQFKLRAFLGAGQIRPPETRPTAAITSPDSSGIALEIAASGRQQDVDTLVWRLEQARYPLITVHGPSGVGKSSILAAGLVPALRRSFPEGRTTLPVLVQGYRDWPDAINQALEVALDRGTEADEAIVPPAAPVDRVTLFERLRRQIDANYHQIVLMFDQFEEFFVETPDLLQRRELYRFLIDCLNAPYLKVVLALREDYLHYLLEIERGFEVDILNNDILSRDYRYYLGNLEQQAAKALIQRLTSEARFFLEPALVNQLVADLVNEAREVSPIELQVVGAQLQRDRIQTLAAYRQLGDHPKTTLVQQFLDNVVHDCGPEQADLANLVLYLLTDDDRNNGLYRPQKSRLDLQEDLDLRGVVYGQDQLDLVLAILVGSGLVFLLPDSPSDRYQLVHDYLLEYVRLEQAPKLLKKLSKSHPPLR